MTWGREMMRKDGGTTSPLLLKRVADWADHRAWGDFFEVYDPLIRSWCGGYRLDDGLLEDLCQQVWIELADRMRTYRYDPGRTFRGWLRQFCHCRAVDLLRKRRTELARFVVDQPADELLLAVDMIDCAEDEDSESRRLDLLAQAEQVQFAVKERAQPQTWQAFWRIAVEGCSFRETAEEMGMTYAAVFAAHKRVGRMLRTEGKRCVSQRSPECPEAITPDPS
jgi:RNA polymerase sigma factor (sigma-70 family)